MSTRPCGIRKTKTNNAYSKSELIALAKKKGITGYSKMNIETLCKELKLSKSIKTSTKSSVTKKSPSKKTKSPIKKQYKSALKIVKSPTRKSNSVNFKSPTIIKISPRKLIKLKPPIPRDFKLKTSNPTYFCVLGSENDKFFITNFFTNYKDALQEIKKYSKKSNILYTNSDKQKSIEKSLKDKKEPLNDKELITFRNISHDKYKIIYNMFTNSTYNCSSKLTNIKHKAYIIRKDDKDCLLVLDIAKNGECKLY